MASLWTETVRMKGFPALQGDAQTDVLIIGGGMAGILCAHRLHQAGVPYLLVEGNTLCSGVTHHTTAKVTVEHGLIYDSIIRRFGLEKARMYLAANQAALEAYRRLCRNRDCDWQERPAYVYALDDRDKVEQELRAYERLGCGAAFAQTEELPFATAGAVRLEAQAQFHPLKFAAAVSEGLHVHEHTQVLALEGTTAVTEHGRIRAKKVIVATHFPFINRHGSYFLKQYQHRSYVLALEEAAQLQGMYVDEAEKGMSLRSHGKHLLIGGGDHRTGKQGGGWQELRAFAGRCYPQAREAYHWAAQDCMTLDGLPYIGPYAAGTRDLYVATGFNKWGMTASMAAAMILCDMVQEKQNPWAEVFSPSRSMLRPQLAINAAEAAVSLLTPTAPRCTHMGCALQWNPQEHSWDCPCHGSRFDEEGRVLDNPATKNLKR